MGRRPGSVIRFQYPCLDCRLWKGRLGQFQEESCPLAAAANETDAASVLLDAALNNRKPQAVPGLAARVRSPEERLENALLLGGRYPDATVPDLDQVVLRISAQADHNRPLRILQRIGQEIVQCLAQPERVGGHRKLLSRALELQPPALLVVSHHCSQNSRRSNGPGSNGSRCIRDRARNSVSEIIACMRRTACCIRSRICPEFSPPPGAWPAPASQHVGVAQDHEERVAQVVHDPPEKLHRPFHLLFLPLVLRLAAAEPNLNGAQQVVQVHRLRQVVIRPEVHALAHLAWLGLAGKKDELGCRRASGRAAAPPTPRSRPCPACSGRTR